MVKIHHGEGELGNSQTVGRSSGNGGLSDDHSVDVVSLLVVGHVEASGGGSGGEVGVGDVAEKIKGSTVVRTEDSPIGGIVGVGHSGGGDTVLVEVLGTVSFIGEIDDEISLRGVFRLPVGGVDEIIDVGDASTSRLSRDRNGEGSADVVGLHLLKGGIEEDGVGVVAGEVDNADSDGVGTGSEDVVGTTDESVGGSRISTNGSSRSGDVTGRKVLSDELDSVDVDDVAGTSLDSQLETIIAGRVHVDGGSEEPDVLSVGGRGIGSIEGVEARDGASSVPVGNKSGGVGPQVGLGVDLVGNIIREVVDAALALIDGRDGVEVTFSIGHLDVESRVGRPAIAVAIGEVDVDNANREAVVEVLSGIVGKGRRGIDSVVSIGNSVGLFVGIAGTDLHEADHRVGREAAALNVQRDLSRGGLRGNVAGGSDGVGLSDSDSRSTTDDTGGGGECYASRKLLVDLEVVVAVDEGSDVDFIDVGVTSERRSIVSKASGFVGKHSVKGLPLSKTALSSNAAAGDAHLVLVVALGVGSHSEVELGKDSWEDNAGLDIKHIPGVAVVGAVDGPSSGIAVGKDIRGLNGVVVDPLSLAVGIGVSDNGCIADHGSIEGAGGSIEDLLNAVDSRHAGRIDVGNTIKESVVAVGSISTCVAEIDVAIEGIGDSRGSRGEMDFKGDDEGARGGEEELVGGNGSVNSIGGRCGGSGGGDRARRHVVSVDLGALDVVDEAVGVVDGGVESRDVLAAGEVAGETVVTGGSGKGREVVSGGSRPAGITERRLGPGVGGLRNIGVLPLGGRSGEEVDGEGVRALLESVAGLVGKTALEDSDVSNGD